MDHEEFDDDFDEVEGISDSRLELPDEFVTQTDAVCLEQAVQLVISIMSRYPVGAANPTSMVRDHYFFLRDLVKEGKDK